ncbi:hypothetical protein [Treponema sp.]|uniref:hypothetical protein n=1 Tax=Treponema sp. TaxID=166 RepID=UPI00388E7F8A
MNRDFISKLILKFSVINTLVFIFSSLFILVFWGFDVNLNLPYVFGCLGLSFFLALLNCLLEIKDNTSKSKALLYNVLFFIMVNASVVSMGLWLKWFDFKDLGMICGFEVTILVVYGIAGFFNWYAGCIMANKMNDRLSKLKEESDD